MSELAPLITAPKFWTPLAPVRVSETRPGNRQRPCPNACPTRLDDVRPLFNHVVSADQYADRNTGCKSIIAAAAAVLDQGQLEFLRQNCSVCSCTNFSAVVVTRGLPRPQVAVLPGTWSHWPCASGGPWFVSGRADSCRRGPDGTAEARVRPNELLGAACRMGRPRLVPVRLPISLGAWHSLRISSHTDT